MKTGGDTTPKLPIRTAVGNRRASQDCGRVKSHSEADASANRV
jgi:hypothetical protein